MKPQVELENCLLWLLQAPCVTGRFLLQSDDIVLRGPELVAAAQRRTELCEHGNRAAG